MISRRGLLQAGGLTAALAARGSAKQLTTVGVQLYTVRNVLPEKPLETLKAIAAIGYKEIEATQAGLDKIWSAVKETKLKPVSIHFDSKLVTQAPADDLKRAADDMKKRGFQFGVMPYLPPAERGGLDVIKKLAARLNQAGEICHKAGLKFAYHNHAFEFESMGGTTPYLTLIENTDPKTVGFEVDVFWVVVGGVEPGLVFQKLKGRIPLVHLKDVAQGTKNQNNENVPKTAFKEVGNGTINWQSILRAADEAGVQHYFVEQDQTPGDPLASLKQSYEYLAKLQY